MSSLAGENGTYISVREVVVQVFPERELNHVNAFDHIKPLGTPRGALLLQLLAGVGLCSGLDKVVELNIHWQATGRGVLDQGMVNTRANH